MSPSRDREGAEAILPAASVATSIQASPERQLGGIVRLVPRQRVAPVARRPGSRSDKRPSGFACERQSRQPETAVGCVTATTSGDPLACVLQTGRPVTHHSEPDPQPNGASPPATAPYIAGPGRRVGWDWSHRFAPVARQPESRSDKRPRNTALRAVRIAQASSRLRPTPYAARRVSSTGTRCFTFIGTGRPATSCRADSIRSASRSRL